MPTYTLSDTMVLLIPQNIMFFTSIHMYLPSNLRFFIHLVSMIAFNFYSISIQFSREVLDDNIPNFIPYVFIYISTAFSGNNRVGITRIESFLQSSLNEIIGKEY